MRRDEATTRVTTEETAHRPHQAPNPPPHSNAQKKSKPTVNTRTTMAFTMSPTLTVLLSMLASHSSQHIRLKKISKCMKNITARNMTPEYKTNLLFVNFVPLICDMSAQPSRVNVVAASNLANGDQK
jgi:hypothetical protein